MEGYENELNVFVEQMDDLNAEIINILANIGVLEAYEFELEGQKDY